MPNVVNQELADKVKSESTLSSEAPSPAPSTASSKDEKSKTSKTNNKDVLPESEETTESQELNKEGEETSEDQEVVNNKEEVRAVFISTVTNSMKYLLLKVVMLLVTFQRRGVFQKRLQPGQNGSFNFQGQVPSSSFISSSYCPFSTINHKLDSCFPAT